MTAADPNRGAGLPSPPRLTGDANIDTSVLLQWVTEFYNQINQNGVFLLTQAQRAEAEYSRSNPPEPGLTTLYLAQRTANDALSAASEGAIVAGGTFTLSDAEIAIPVTFNTARDNATYTVIVMPTGKTGTPVPEAFIVESIAKTMTGFTITMLDAPGASASVTYDFLVFP